MILYKYDFDLKLVLISKKHKKTALQMQKRLLNKLNQF
ncbi:hypothetical protein FLJC2902T_17850 [Flavobacterium limnosediminis JC2902]|uniref:Uncharacterized protein n=1 Tax=Flavobacterium limnosediminis JC2902 TaxID=1341181 RepID=V6SPP2_9FLAO|nr:hypothetical protein FLJC2902T_17850 [Flavobacterium limnosediminis JC2902]